MNSKICAFCGSSNFIADRALAGKIVCSGCGKPVSNYRFSNNNKYRQIDSNTKIILLFILVIFIVILLA